MEKAMNIGSEEWKRVLRSGLEEMGIPVDSARLDSLAIHAVELMEFNQKINLTAIKEPLKVLVDHYLDSIAGVRILPEAGRMLDIGSGGGFPGIPLKIMHPGMDVLFLDSSRKKVSFLKHVIRTLGLKSARARHARAQDFAREPEFLSAFDIVVGRALSSLVDLYQMAAPLVRPNGQIIAWKSESQSDEADALHSILQKTSSSPKSEISFRIVNYILPYTHVKRSLIIIS